MMADLPTYEVDDKEVDLKGSSEKIPITEQNAEEFKKMFNL